MTSLLLVFAGVLGALIGSFGNVVIWRLPRRESVVHPGSHCPNCDRRLGPLELVPILSWLALGGRCRNCRQPIAVRYPLVEALMAALFVALVWRWSPLDFGWAVLPLLVVVAMLTMAAIIDIDHFILPDVLTFGALAVALAGSFLTGQAADLPVPLEALAGALTGAGVLVLINRIGALVLRRFTDTKERLFPFSLDQANVAAVAGAVGGVWVGVAAGAVSLLANLVARRILRIPEPLAYGLWLVALVLSSTTFTVPTFTAVAGSVMAAGAWALVGALYWWLHDLVKPEPEQAEEEQAPAEPVAMGFGDVKLAAVLGAILGWEKFLVGLFLAVSLGALFGIVQRIAGGGRLIPFGPYLLAGALLALFFGDAAISWYFGLLLGDQ
ncbi:MAG: prepilin peptidase [Trueperaceae bacterium]|jgi:leader peptidase (prepilin peptidase)/N-methyltransferase